MPHPTPSRETAEIAGQWLPIETAPHTRKVLVSYLNRAGKRRVVMACYYEEGELPMSDSYMGDEEFAEPGWYEECETADETIYPVEGEPDIWHEIPPLPTIARATGDQQS